MSLFLIYDVLYAHIYIGFLGFLGKEDFGVG